MDVNPYEPPKEPDSLNQPSPTHDWYPSLLVDALIVVAILVVIAALLVPAVNL